MDAALKAYLDRWQEVAELERQELREVSLELRWQQLNTIIGMAIGLGILIPDDDEAEVYQRWANLKKKAADHPTA